MKPTTAILLLLLSSLLCHAAERSIVYNRISEKRSELDDVVATALAPKYSVKDVRDSEGYVPPKPIAGHLPRTARTPDGKPLGGTALIGYVITTDGRVVAPFVVKSTGEAVSSIAMKTMEEWRFIPATLKGVAIATTAGQEFEFETPPTEFVEQVLEPTGGRIQRPKDWFYAEGHGGPVYLWTISRENTAGGRRYNTGVRIQLFSGVKQGTGKTAKQFILDFLASKKKEADKVLKTCEEKPQGLFTRICLETEEGPDHVLYSLFWMTSGTDIAVVTIAGTSKELWETYAPTFDKMGAFELIDMKRFEK